MIQLTVQISDELAKQLQTIAQAQGISVEKAASEALGRVAIDRGTPLAVLRAALSNSPASTEAIEELEDAIRAGRRKRQDPDIFAD